MTSPFALTADREGARCWAGRPHVLGNLQRMCKGFENRSDSSLDMIWANLGAGKSHALMHLSYLLEGTLGPNKCVTAFVEMPEQLKHFIDLYRRIMNEVPLELLAKEIVATRQHKVPANLQNAARVLIHGGPADRDLARQWILADRPPLRDLKTVTGIGQRIEEDRLASEILGSIVDVFAHRRIRFVLLLDEFQRVSVLPPRGREAVLSHLRSIFSKNPAYFSVVIAVASRIEKTAAELLPQELRTLMGMRPAVSLPEMDSQEALEFVIGRFRFYRPPGYRGPATAPFGDATLQAIIDNIAGIDKARLIPRVLFQALAWIYDSEAIPGKDEIDPERALACLKELKWDLSG